MKKLLKILICSLLACFSAYALTACGGGNTPPAGALVVNLSSSQVTLEKLEDYTLQAIVSDSYQTASWSVSDPEVVSITADGLKCKISALTEGRTTVSVTVDDVKKDCLVIVNDGGLMPSITVNAEDDGITISDVDEYALTPSLYYNGKPVSDVEYSYEVISGGENLTVDTNGRLTAVKVGTAQVVITANWKNIPAVKPINVNIVTSLSGFLSDTSNLILYTYDLNGEITQKQLVTKLYQKNVLVPTSDYQVQIKDTYDTSVIEIDGTTVKAKSQGATTLEATFTKGESQIDVTLPVIVKLTEHSQVINLAWLEVEGSSNYTFDSISIFEGMPSNQTVKTAVDVTDVDTPVDIAVNDNTIDVSQLSGEFNLHGERVWEISNGLVKCKARITVYTKRISDAYEFMEISNSYGNDATADNKFFYQGYYILTDDIDFGSQKYGRFDTVDFNKRTDKAYFGDGTAVGFNGTFDGNGKAIYGFEHIGVQYNGTPSVVGAGLFGLIGANGIVKNLSVRDYAYFTYNWSGCGVLGMGIYGGKIDNVQIAYDGDENVNNASGAGVLFGYIEPSTTVQNVNIFYGAKTGYAYAVVNGWTSEASSVMTNAKDINVISYSPMFAVESGNDAKTKECTNYACIIESNIVNVGVTFDIMSKPYAIDGLTLSLKQNYNGISITDYGRVTVLDEASTDNAFVVVLEWQIAGKTITREISYLVSRDVANVVDLSSTKSKTLEVYGGSNGNYTSNTISLSELQALISDNLADEETLLSVMDATTNAPIPTTSGQVALGTIATANHGETTWLLVSSNNVAYKIKVNLITKKISTAQEFMDMDNAYGNTASTTKSYTGYFVLANDIDFNGQSYIRSYFNSNNQNTFVGTFDGKGYALKNFKLKCSPDSGNAPDSGGLFGKLGETSVIKNLTITDFDLDYSKTYSFNLLGPVLNGSIENLTIATTLSVEAQVWNFFVLGANANSTLKLKNVNVFIDTVDNKTIVSDAETWYHSGLFTRLGWNDTDIQTILSNSSNINVVINNLEGLDPTSGSQVFANGVNYLQVEKFAIANGTATVMSKSLPTGMTLAILEENSGISINGNTITVTQDCVFAEATLRIAWEVGGQTLIKDISFVTGIDFVEVDLTEQTAFAKELYTADGSSYVASPVTETDLLTYLGLDQSYKVLRVIDASTNQKLSMDSLFGKGVWFVEVSNLTSYKINAEVVTKYVTSATDFKAMSTSFGNTGSGNYTGYFVLVNDIDFGGEAYSNTAGTFIGTLDGNGYAIKNFKLNHTDGINHPNHLNGLFGSVGAKAVIKNLTIKEFDIFSDANLGFALFGKVVAGTIENVNIVVTDTDVTTNNLNQLAVLGYQPATTTVLKDINIFIDIPDSLGYSWKTTYLFANMNDQTIDGTVFKNNCTNINVIANFTNYDDKTKTATNYLIYDTLTVAKGGSVSIMSKGLVGDMSFTVEGFDGVSIDGNTLTVESTCQLSQATITLSWTVGGVAVTKTFTVSIA